MGSQLVQFALIWWLTITTGSATVLATASIVGILPQVLLGPVAGALVDRWSRRVTMILADLLIAGVTIGLAVLFAIGVAQPWHVYLVLFLRATAGSFHFPAMAASTSLMVPKEHLTRIQGANQTLQGGLNIVAAPLGALLMELLPMQGIVAIDFVTALLAVLPLLFIQVLQPAAVLQTAGPGKSKPSVWEDLRAGVRYVWKWPGLFAIMIMAAVINLALNPAFALLPILVKNVFGGGAIQLAWIESTGGLGILAGGLLFTMPIINGSSQAIWQSKVPPDLQGRVFSVRRMIAWSTLPLAYMIAGPLADNVFKPLLAEGGALAGSVGLVLGVGPGRGTGLMFVVIGFLAILAAGSGYLNPRVRKVEDELPDAIEEKPVEELEAAGSSDGPFIQPAGSSAG